MAENNRPAHAATLEGSGGASHTKAEFALVSGLSLKSLGIAVGRVPTNDLSRAESASTLFRFFRSHHVRDLKLIAALALSALSIHFVLAVLFGLFSLYSTAHGAPPATGLAKSLSDFFAFVVKHFGSALPIYGVIVGWAYQSASKRLGIVDLFACEIATLCRVGTMFDIGKRYVSDYSAPAGKRLRWPGSGRFVSKEEYFPVFDANSRDLQLLDAAVVENITQFYTYMKAVRDLQRKLADSEAPQNAAASEGGLADSEPCQDAAGSEADAVQTDYQRGLIASIIYLLFLGYESAREAVHDLVEFQPDAAERAIAILLTELPCYAFLLKYYKEDNVRYKRLKLREARYEDRIPELYIEVMISPHGKNEEEWLPAKWTAIELATRYKEAFGEEMNAAVARVSRKASEVGMQTGSPPQFD